MFHLLYPIASAANLLLSKFILKFHAWYYYMSRTQRSDFKALTHKWYWNAKFETCGIYFSFWCFILFLWFFCHHHFVLVDFFSVLVVFSFLSVYIGFDIVITVFLHHKWGFWIKFGGTIFFLKRPKYSNNLCGFTLWQFSLEYLGLLKKNQR